VGLAAILPLAACGSSQTTPRPTGTARVTTGAAIAPKPVTPKRATSKATTARRKQAAARKPTAKHATVQAQPTTTALTTSTPAASSTQPASSAHATSDRTYGLVPHHGLFLLSTSIHASASTLRILGKGGQVCWSFGPGVAHKTAAEIDTGAPGTTSTTVLKLGKSYQASGCVTAKSRMLDGLVKYPAAFYVSVNGGMGL